MGCLHSKKETSDLHPNVYRVVNIDENGLELCSGQLEITDSDIILYREGRDSTIWPLHSLRRYGFEEDIFSFESGRRCETGEGIYAFRCRRAISLFRTLQRQIQLRNVIHESVPYPVSHLSPSPQGRRTLHVTVVHRASIDNGRAEIMVHSNSMLQTTTPNTAATSNFNQSPRSPSSADILEVMPLYPRPEANINHVTNVYQLRDFKKEHNNNQSDSSADPRHVYSNDLNRDLAILRNTLRQETALNTMRDIEDETKFLESRYMNEGIGKNQQQTLSPTHSTNSEHYAELSLEQQQLEANRMYMNVDPEKIKKASVPDINKNDAAPTTPLTPKQVEYSNLGVSHRVEINMYANLMVGELAESIKNAKQHYPPHEHTQKHSESDTITSLSPVEETEVNYAVLDIDTNKEMSKTTEVVSPENRSYISPKKENTASSSQTRGKLMPQMSLEKPVTSASTMPTCIGYTTIDFDKTVALTSVAAGADIDLDCPRKTRHNSLNIMCGSPSISDRNKTTN